MDEKETTPCSVEWSEGRSDTHCGLAFGDLPRRVNTEGELVPGQRERLPVAEFAYIASPWGCALGLMF